MYILGLNAYHADSSAAIFRNGELIAASEEERFRRVKHWAGFPSKAIEFCLEEANISLKDLSYITIGRDPRAKLGKKFLFLLKSPLYGLKNVRERINNAKSISSLEEELIFIDPSIDIKTIKSKIKFIEHHRSHLASAFFASPYNEAAILSIDGSGDFTTTMTAIGTDNRIEVLDSVDFPHSLGLFYSALTQLLGFNNYGDEYKVMGLAPYGKPLYTDKLKDILQFKNNGLFSLNLEYFRSPRKGWINYGNDNIPRVPFLCSELLIDKLGPVRKSSETINQYYMDLAASVQDITEQLLFHILNDLNKKTGLDKVCIAGGVAQNSVANGKITRNTNFKHVYVPSAGHDAGISMGSALYFYNSVLKQKRTPPIYSAFTGSSFSNESIEGILKNKNIEYEKCEDDLLFDKITDQLINAGVVGWFNGRAEFGPRALGARSIIADPRRQDAKELLNLKIKRRENFRPFAPSVLKEYVSEYFDITDDVPFMEKVFPIKSGKHSVIPAVTHVDGTGRLQTVDKDINPRYYKLIDTFRKKTGIPILLNTSFNENEPIVNSPEEALDCFMRTNMDMLVLENYIIRRQNK